MAENQYDVYENIRIPEREKGRPDKTGPPMELKLFLSRKEAFGWLTACLVLSMLCFVVYHYVISNQIWLNSSLLKFNNDLVQVINWQNQKLDGQEKRILELEKRAGVPAPVPQVQSQPQPQTAPQAPPIPAPVQPGK